MLKIEITAQTGIELSARDQIDEALRALGYVRESDAVGQRVFTPEKSVSSHNETEAEQPEAEEASSFEQPLLPAGDAPKRERGKPSPGRQRRTKEEMAEDAAAEAAEVQAGAPQIQTNPENRVGPQDTPEDQAQDAADEKAESDANRGTALSLDDVREAVGRYYTKFGMGPATADIQSIFGCKLHEIPDDQNAFRKAIAAVDDAAEKNPYGRTPVGGPVAPAPKTTLDDLKVVMGRYMKMFGEDEGYADLPRILGVARVTELPNDPEIYKAKIGLVEDALAGNPFGRKVRS